MTRRQSDDITIRPGKREDADAIHELFIVVARISGGLARMEDEIDAEYVEDCVEKSLEDGVLLVAESAGRVVGELHTYRVPQRKFAHVLGNLTVAVHPDTQGQGVGRRLFETLIADVRERRPEIVRIELITQESNLRGQRLYESLGFVRQGRFERGILGPHGRPENDIPMAWLRPQEPGARS